VGVESVLHFGREHIHLLASLYIFVQKRQDCGFRHAKIGNLPNDTFQRFQATDEICKKNDEICKKTMKSVSSFTIIEGCLRRYAHLEPMKFVRKTMKFVKRPNDEICKKNDEICKQTMKSVMTFAIFEGCLRRFAHLGSMKFVRKTMKFVMGINMLF
jgi:hypothetical protein